VHYVGHYTISFQNTRSLQLKKTLILFVVATCFVLLQKHCLCAYAVLLNNHTLQYLKGCCLRTLHIKTENLNINTKHSQLINRIGGNNNNNHHHVGVMELNRSGQNWGTRMGDLRKIRLFTHYGLFNTKI
jgi:hypothetical protein